jgi:hypothetical protein
MFEFLNLFADAACELNQTLPGFGNFQPGIGPYNEQRIISETINRLIQKNRINPNDAYIEPRTQTRIQLGLENYQNTNGRAATPDLIYNRNIIEFKICRPLRDNGGREDTWFSTVYEPYSSSGSAFKDVERLCRFRNNFDLDNNWGKWVIIIGFERQNETEYQLDNLFPRLFEFISEKIIEFPYQDFLTVKRDMGDRHPYHQILKLYAFQY